MTRRTRNLLKTFKVFVRNRSCSRKTRQPSNAIDAEAAQNQRKARLTAALQSKSGRICDAVIVLSMTMSAPEVQRQGFSIERNVLRLGSGVTALAAARELCDGGVGQLSLGAAVGTAYVYLSAIILRVCAAALLTQPVNTWIALGAVAIKAGLFFCFVLFLGAGPPPLVYGALLGLLCIIPAAWRAYLGRDSSD